MKKVLLLLLCFAAAYLIPLGVRPLVTPDEFRYAQIPYEMLESGNDFCVNDFCVAAKACWNKDKIAAANMVAYEYLREKMHAGILETFTVETPGSGRNLTAPQQRYRKKQQ